MKIIILLVLCCNFLLISSCVPIHEHYLYPSSKEGQILGWYGVPREIKFNKQGVELRVRGDFVYENKNTTVELIIGVNTKTDVTLNLKKIALFNDKTGETMLPSNVDLLYWNNEKVDKFKVTDFDGPFKIPKNTTVLFDLFYVLSPKLVKQFPLSLQEIVVSLGNQNTVVFPSVNFIPSSQWRIGGM